MSPKREYTRKTNFELSPKENKRNGKSKKKREKKKRVGKATPKHLDII